MRLFATAVALAATAAVPAVGRIERPVTQEKFQYDPASGYILVWVGPMKGKSSFKDFVDFVRIDPSTGTALIRDDGLLRSTNRRALKDAAAVYYEAKPWVIKDDRGLFLMPVAAGSWVIGSVNNTALSMGTYGFDVAPGKITYVGTVITGKEDATSPIPEILEAGRKVLSYEGNAPNIPHTIVYRPAAIDELPPSVPRDHLVVPAIRKDVRFNNFMSGLVGRAADLGVMSHQNPVPNPSK